MNKSIVFILVVSLLIFGGTSLAHAAGYFEAKITADIAGELEIGSFAWDTDTGFTIIGEYKVPVNSRWTLGGGIAHQFDREIENSNIDFSFTSFYGLAQYDLVNSPMYLVGRLGFSNFEYDLPISSDGGLYIAFGAGLTFGQYNDYVAEALYSINNGELGSVDVDYTKISLSIGKRF